MVRAWSLLYRRALLPDFESATRRLQGDEIVSATAAIGLRIGIRYEGRHFWLSVCVGASMFVYAVARWRWAAARLRKRMAPSADRGTAVGGGSRPMK